jgi:hypothetical protein
MSFSHHPTRRMKFNAVAAGFFTSPQKMRRFISKSLAKNVTTQVVLDSSRKAQGFGEV